MALRNFLFQSAEGYFQEQAPTDSLDLGGLAMTGDITMGSNKVTGAAAATASGDLISYGQSGALLSGLALSGGNLDLSGLQKVINSIPPTAAGDLTTKAYVDTLVVTGGQIKEALSSEGQISNPQGILANEVLFFANQPTAGDTVVLKNASLTRTYLFVANIGAESAATDVSIETDALTAMQRLVLRANADAGNTQWTLHVDANSQRLNATGYVIMVAEKVSAAGNSTSRIYGTWTTANDAKVVEFASGSPGVPYTDYTSIISITMPSADPAAGRFGFRRQASALVDGELHFTLDENNIWAWDQDSATWQQFSGSGSMPDATSGAGGAVKGKITVDEDYALFVSSGILRMALQTTGGLQFNAGTPKTLGIKLDTNPGLSLSGTGLKGVVTSGKGLTISATGFEVVADNTRAIATDASGVYLMLAANPGLEFNGSTGVQAKIYSAGGLLRDANGLSIKYPTTGPYAGLFTDANGLQVKTEATNPTLAVNASNELGVKYDSTKALGTSAAGLYVKVDGTSITYSGGVLQAASSSEAPKVENTINVDAAVAVGDPIYITATGARISPADTDTDPHSRVMGVARTAQGTVGQPAEVVEVGYCAGVLSGATPGTPYYLATGGGLATAAPSGAGKRVIQVGVAITASDLMVRIVDYGKKA